MLAELLHKVAAMEAAEKEEHAYYPRPSLAGPERCLRQMVYWARGEAKTPIPGRSIVVMEDSSWHEELTADLVRKSAFQIHSQQMPVTLPGVLDWREDKPRKCHVCGETASERDFHGHIDFLVTDLAGQDLMIEHKALSHFSWEALAEGELPLDYLTQVAIYLRALQLVNPTLTRALLLAKNKNTSGYLEFVCEYVSDTDTLTVIESRTHTNEVRVIGKPLERIVGDALERFRMVETYLAKGKLPLRQYAWDHWRCDYCQYNQVCWGNYLEEHANLKTDQKIGGWAHALLQQYRELGEQKSALEKTREGLRKEITDALTRLGVREGVSEDMAVKWAVNPVRRLNADLLPPDVREAATKEAMQERLTVRQLKGKSTGGKP